MVVVFDFDKTISVKDTFNDFLFFFGERDRYYQLKRVVYHLVTVLRKFRAISNFSQKRIGCKLFINPDLIKDQSLINEFAASIDLNNSVINELQQFMDDDTARVIICSASPKFYLQAILPDLEIIGMEFFQRNGKLRISQHPYKDKKRELLKLHGIRKIEVLYTDSYSDKSLAEISDCTKLVNGDNISPCLSFDEFRKSTQFLRRMLKS